ncbi:MAG: D-2-hydroxyacid dehydrogenase [Candidatus Marinimicrobia bacterium]|nr:D-2-hydroxyacid dehydrogenase [Candidatus Neomarinimicrobiota bacterium]
MEERKVKVHFKSNHADPKSFPPTIEGESVFAFTEARFNEALENYPDLKGKIEPVFDWDLDNFYESMKTAEVLVCWDFPTENLAEIAPNLRWIHIIGAGIEHLCPMDWVPNNVSVVNNKGVHSAKAGEFGLMSVLMLHTHIPQIIANQRNNHWESLYSTPIKGKTLLVIGVGNIGYSVAKKCIALGMNVIGVSRHGKTLDDVDEMVSTDQLDEVLPKADYIFMSIPNTSETNNLLDGRRQSLMKPGVGIVNVGRAATMDYTALADNLNSGHIGAAIIDVFDPEPLPKNSPLWSTPNLMIMPHISADDGDTYIPLTLELVLMNMRRYLAGEELKNLVRPDLGY